jgi:hypothetical protein
MANDSMISIFVIGLTTCVIAHLVIQMASRGLCLLRLIVTQLWKKVFPIHIYVSISFGGPLQRKNNAVGRLLGQLMKRA